MFRTVLACSTTQGLEESVECPPIIVFPCQDLALMNPGDLACMRLLVHVIIMFVSMVTGLNSVMARFTL